MDIFSFTLSSLVGFFSFNFLTGKKSGIFDKIPNLRIKFLQICPSVKIFVRGKTIHFHHWFNLTVILVITIIVNAGILDTLIARGILFGGIVQGITVENWSKIIYSINSSTKNFKKK